MTILGKWLNTPIRRSKASPGIILKVKISCSIRTLKSWCVIYTKRFTFKIVEHTVVVLSSKVVLKTERVVRLTILCRISSSSKPGRVVNLNSCKRLKCLRRTISSVMLSTVVWSSSCSICSSILLNRKPELTASTVPLVNVEWLILVKRHHHVVGINGSSKELNSVIRVVVNLNIRDLCSASNCSKSQSVNLVVRCKLISTVTDRYVFKLSRVILVIKSSVRY